MSCCERTARVALALVLGIYSWLLCQTDALETILGLATRFRLNAMCDPPATRLVNRYKQSTPRDAPGLSQCQHVSRIIATLWTDTRRALKIASAGGEMVFRMWSTESTPCLSRGRGGRFFFPQGRIGATWHFSASGPKQPPGVEAVAALEPPAFSGA
ncbi:hypothetical protein B0J12DRAFT_686545 [Macrophomina phaseolina]|uniref:Secreted protein n=1 Tax=Macrophomina phaseolina TaxID=35725 RepID=A0ABQ8FU36_9PEZI|nr:hypothetical protein B0J12DRAFT_686545 [Macrophomina phaseolina]